MTAVTRMIETQEPSRTGTLGEALKEKLNSDKAERTVESHPLPDPRTIAKRLGSHTILVYRDKLRLELYAPEGYMMATGTFADLSELSDNVAHFLSRHPQTTVITH